MNSRQLVATSLYRLGMTSLMRKLQRPGLGILMFHGFTDEPLDPLENSNDLHQSVAKFEAICAHLKQHYNVLPLEEAVRKLRAGQRLPDKSVVITLDDGLASNYHFAFPILKRYQLPASLFVATEFIDQKAWLWPDRLEYALGRTTHTSVTTDLTGAPQTWSLASTSDRIQTIRSLGAQFKALAQEQLHGKLAELEVMLECSLATAANPPVIYHPLTWDQIREMDASGVITIGAHTHRHLILGRCTPGTAAFEMATSCTILEQQLGKHPIIFAYPNGQCGDFNRTTEHLLAAFQIEAAVTTEPGFNESISTTNLLALRRFGQPDSPAHLELILSDTARFLKNTVPRPARIAALMASLTIFLIISLRLSPEGEAGMEAIPVATYAEEMVLHPNHQERRSALPPFSPTTPTLHDDTDTASSRFKSFPNH